MTTITARECIDLIIRDYRGEHIPGTIDEIPGTARVIRYKDTIGIIPQGTQSWLDWISNAWIFPRRWRRKLTALAIGDRTAKGHTLRWHAGFLAEAVRIYDWCEKNGYKIEWVAAHSRGGAVGQILAYSWGVPAILFNSPLPLIDPSTRTHETIKIYNNSADLVGNVPPGNAHIGRLNTRQPGHDEHSAEWVAADLDGGKMINGIIEVLR